MCVCVCIIWCYGRHTHTQRNKTEKPNKNCMNDVYLTYQEDNKKKVENKKIKHQPVLIYLVNGKNALDTLRL